MSEADGGPGGDDGPARAATPVPPRATPVPPRATPARSGRPERAGSPVGRRVVLGLLGLGAVGVVAGARLSNGIDALLGPLEHDDPTGLTSLIPGGDQWRFYTVTSGFPHESDTVYRLRVDGLVDRPTTYDLPALKALPATSLVRDFQCVTGWRVPQVHWTGVLLSDVLDRAGVQAGARALRFESFDGTYTESLTLDQARRPDVLVAWSMLGAPVTTDHGGPVRLYVAPMYGYKSCKWLSRIEVVDRVEPGYWEVEGNYSVDAWIGASNGE